MVPFLIIHPLPTCVHTVWTLRIPFCTFWARSSTHCWLVFGMKSARPAPLRRDNERAASRVESSGNVCVKVTDPHGGFHHLCALGFQSKRKENQAALALVTSASLLRSLRQKPRVGVLCVISEDARFCEPVLVRALLS